MKRRKVKFSMRKSYNRRYGNNGFVKFLKIFLIIIAAVAIVYIGFVSAKFVQKIMNGEAENPFKQLFNHETKDASNETDKDKPETPEVNTQSAVSSKDISPGNLESIDDVINTAKENNISNIIIEIKNEKGNLYYKTQNEKIPVESAVNAVDLKSTVDKAKQKGVSVGVKINCFKDNTAPRKIPEAGVGVRKGYLWLDGTNSRWLNPYYSEATDYLAAIVKDAADAGVQEIILDSVEFPSIGKTDMIEYEKNKPEISKEQALINFVGLMKKTAGSNVKVGVMSGINYLADKNSGNIKSGKSYKTSTSADFAVPDLTLDTLKDYMDLIGVTDVNTNPQDTYAKAFNKIKANITEDKIYPVIDQNNVDAASENKCHGYIIK